MTAIRWVPLESNPELFTAWSESMGLDTTKYVYTDIFGLDDDLLAMVPQPVEAVLCLFPITKENSSVMKSEDENVSEYVGPEKEGELLWFKQTIGNACGTIGLLHSIVNSSARSSLNESSPLGQLIKDVSPLTARERAEYLQSSKPLAQAHTSVASTGQTAAPPANDRVDLHFVSFVRDPRSSHLFELDGRRKGPVDRKVKVPKQEDLLKSATQWINENYMRLNPEEVNFNLIALAAVN